MRSERSVEVVLFCTQTSYFHTTNSKKEYHIRVTTGIENIITYVRF